jgi:transposase
MSLQPQPWPEIPEETARVARLVMQRGEVPLAIRVRNELGELFADEEFAEAFAVRGKPGWSPGRLAMVTVLQMADNLTDRAAAHRVRFDISWKYCLGLGLNDPGFDPSVLSEFRGRLVEHGLEERVLDLLVARLKERGLIKDRGKQRTDSTQVAAAVRELSRLELAGEAVRAAVEALASAAPRWLATVLEVAQWQARYGRRIDESWRPPASKAKREALALDFGTDGIRLLHAVYHANSPVWLRELPAVQVLRQIMVQNYAVTTDRNGREVVKRREADKEGLPPSGLRVTSPYDLDARYGVKDDKFWVGYKLHISETCQEPGVPPGHPPVAGSDRGRPAVPNLITHVETTDATVPDIHLVTPVHQALAWRGVLPAEHYLDSGYASATVIVDALKTFNVVLVTPLQADVSRQTRENRGYRREDFAVDWEARQVTCPQGAVSQYWHPGIRSGHEVIAVRFDPGTCGPCPARAQCTTGKRYGRQIALRPREIHELVQANRAAQNDEDWQAKYALRAGVEGTIHQAVQVTGSHHTRYRGLAKTHLEHVYSAVALNLIRLDAWWNNCPLDHRRTSHLARLNVALAA